MRHRSILAGTVVLGLLCSLGLEAQQSDSSASNNTNLPASSQSAAGTVPRLIKFTGEINPQITQIALMKQSEGGKNPLPTVVGVTFSLYELQEGGSPLWSESQKVQVDERGHYSVLLGSTQPEGLPLDLFSTGKALWVGVQPQLPGQAEQPRVLLVAVPYSLKSSDADTLGGLPASAYALAGSAALLAPAAGTSPSSSSSSAGAQSSNPTTGGPVPGPPPPGPCKSLTADGSAFPHQVALYSAPCALTEDTQFVDVAGKVGIGTTTPLSPLHVVGNFGSKAANQYAVNVATNWTPTANDPTYAALGMNFLAGKFGPFNSTAGIGVGGVEGMSYNAGSGNMSGAAGMVGGVENAGTGTITNAYGNYLFSPIAAAGSPITNGYGIYINSQKATGVTNGYGIYATGASDINYLAGSVGIGTSTPTGMLEVNGTAKFDGLISFASGQTFPGGTVTGGETVQGSVTASGQLVSTVATGTAPLQVASTTPVANLNADMLDGLHASAFQPVGSYATLGANTFAAGQTISSGNLSLPQTASASTGVVNLGGTPFMHACCPNSTQNTFVGSNAGNFTADATSSNGGIGGNTAVGLQALNQLSSGFGNTGVGFEALQALSSGQGNTAQGFFALVSNSTGSGNTAVGMDALVSSNGASGNTAVGEFALSNNLGGSYTTAVGYGVGHTQNGEQEGGTNNTYIGANVGPGVYTDLSNATAIGANAIVDESNALILGGSGTNAVDVGIGTASPYNDYALDVEAVTNSQINSGEVVNAGGGNIYLGMTSGVHQFRVDSAGGVHASSYNTTGVDFAESVAVHGSKSLYEPGDLLAIERGARRRLTRSHTPYSTLVAGIYSTKPGMLAAPHPVDADFDGEVPLAIVGIVPCKVTAENGPIREGDLLVSSSRPGYAMKGTNRRRMLGAVVGKALEPLDKASGVIQVLVTLQ